jgi:D-3-phosphoglycerate dehydrogenase
VGASSFSHEVPEHDVVLNPYGRKMTEGEIIDHLQGADGLLAGLEPLNERVFSSCPGLRAIARIGIGMDNVDIEAAEHFGIKVSNTPDAPTYAVAEMTLAALLSIARRIVHANADMHNGEWKKMMGVSLMDSTVLIIGYGRIGKRFAQMLKPFGVNLLIYDPLHSHEKLDDLLPLADIISLHASGNSLILGEAQFKLLKESVIILNSARGGLVDEKALYDFLGGDVYYWGDTFTDEPYCGILTKHPNAVLTPHISTYTTICRMQMETQAVANLLEDLNES